MLSEFIQLNAFKSQPILPKKLPFSTYDPKFSLQISQNTNSRHPENSEQLIPKKSGKTPLKHSNVQLQASSIRLSSNSNFSNSSLNKKSGLLTSRQPINNFCPGWNQTQSVQMQNNKIPLILSPQRQNSFSKEKVNSIERTPFITNSSNQFIPSTGSEKNPFQRDSVGSETFKYSLQKKASLIKSAQEQIFHQSSKYGNINMKQSGSKKILLKSTSQQNLSPLKQKLFKISQNLKKENSQEKRQNLLIGKKIGKSDSFKRLIEESRQKRKVQASEKENIGSDLNVEYYIGAKVARPQLGHVKSRKFITVTEKLIRSPSKKCKNQFAQRVFLGVESRKRDEVQQSEIETKKADSFVEEHVVNSNMFSFNQEDSSILNMDPY